MTNARREDWTMRIPALVHLSRLGYAYLPRAALSRRDRETNILPEELVAAVERINRARPGEGAFPRLMEALRRRLDAEDLGEAFYQTLRNGWDGLRLIDFENPENNRFQCATELSCGSGAGSFRPDITLFVNGLPLAMIEVKTGERPRGLRAEYDRMLERFRRREGRRYLQCAQVWAFSDDRAEDPDRLMPTEGPYFAAAAAGGFPVYAARGTHPGIPARLPRRNPAEEERILQDNGIREHPPAAAFRRSLSPRKPTHRALTSLFSPERFLFLLRYGIRFVREAEPEGKETLSRRMLSAGQLAALEALIPKARRGYRNWTVPCFGAAGENAVRASLVALLRDLVPGAGLYWISRDEGELRRDRAALFSCGVSCARPADAGEGTVALMTAEEVSAMGPPEAGGTPGRRVFILPQPALRYGQKGGFPAALRKANPTAILVTRSANRTEDGIPLPAPEEGTAGVLYCLSAPPAGTGAER